MTDQAQGAGVLPELGILIDGRWHDSESTIEDRDPATGVLVAEVGAASAVQVAEAIAAARSAHSRWAAMAPRVRGRLLGAVADGIRAKADWLARLESIDTGKPISQARSDVEVAAQYFEFYAGMADKVYGTTMPLAGDSMAWTLREPRGVTAHIVPWNYPLQISARTVAPALMAGNACVLKPAEEAPLTVLALGQLVLEAGLPPGVLNVIPGVGAVAGASLASSDEIDHLSFTGGLDTGASVMTAAAKNVKPVLLELGGKSPNIVLSDADLDRALPVIVRSVVQNAGQTCSAGSRVIVDRSLSAEVVERLQVAFKALRLGRGLDDPDVGPLISPAQLDQALARVSGAVAEGATLVAGGNRVSVPGCADGNFIAPALLTDVRQGFGIATQEVFGPVVAVVVAEDDEHAATICDATPFGLVVGLWTRDIDRALRMTRRVRCGQVFVNSYGAGGGVMLPFGGVKKSGFGREKGVEAVLEYTQTKTVLFDVEAWLKEEVEQ